LDREADRAAGPQEAQAKRTKWVRGVVYGIEKITEDAWLSSSRKMVIALGWRRRRDYEQLFRGLERLGEFRDIDNFDAYLALAAVRSVSIYFELLCTDTARYFEGRFRRAGKAYTLGDAIERQAGVD
jgi:hypothetical protein